MEKKYQSLMMTIFRKCLVNKLVLRDIMLGIPQLTSHGYMSCAWCTVFFFFPLSLNRIKPQTKLLTHSKVCELHKPEYCNIYAGSWYLH